MAKTAIDGASRDGDRYADGSLPPPTHDYAKPLARVLLNETCEGMKALTDETREMLEQLGTE
jgi:hypothetical protein